MKTVFEKFRRNTPAMLALATLPLALLITGISWFTSPKFSDSAERPKARVLASERVYSSNQSRFQNREGQPDRPPRGERKERRRGGRHHGPPSPPLVPPTVLFLIGGGLGYLIGRGRHGRCGPPPHHFRPDYYPPGHPAHQHPGAYQPQPSPPENP